MAIAQATFGPLTDIRGVCLPLTRSVSPSAFTLYVRPQDGLDVGVQTLALGTDDSALHLSGCILSTAYVRKHWDQKSPLWSLYGFDRRWRWRFYYASGDYNRRKPDGRLDTATQKSPGELATLLGTTLGETIDVSRMPTGVFPRALWSNQRADLALQQLCDYVACDVVLNPISDGVEIWPLGTGQNTPTDLTEILPKYRYVPRSNIPSRIEVHGGDSLYQTKLQLKAVARNQNGDQKLLTNWEALSSSAIATQSPFSFPDIANTTNRENAYECYMREFRVTGQQSGALAVPNCQVAVSSIEQYILNDYLLDNEKDIEGFSRSLPYYIDGDYWAYTDLPNNTSSMRFTGGSQLFKDRRLVKTAFPVFKLSSSGAYAEPALYLTTSYKVQDTNRQTAHIVRSGNVGGAGGALVLKRPEIFATYSSSTLPGSQASTEAQANQEADQYVQIFQQKFSNPMASEITYAGFVPGTLDGNVAQATWQIHPSRGIETKVCEGEELDIFSVGLNERRRRQALDRLVEAI
jgi:hypothetical protein